MALLGEPALRLDAPVIARFRQALDELGYDRLLRAVRGSYPLTPFPPYLEFRRRVRTLPQEERLWFELLLLGRILPEVVVRHAMGVETIEDLLTLRVLTRRGTRVATPGLGLTSLDGRYVFASLPNSYPTCRDSDRHAYIGEESYLLTHFLPADRVRSALDICSGSGLLGIVMARIADHVVAVDIDPIAVNVGAFNAELNGLSKVLSTRQGDLWQPLIGEKFDLVTFNAPFVVSPMGHRQVAYRDGGPDGLSVLGPLLDGLAAHLTDKGEAVTFAEGYGDESEPFLVNLLATLAERDGLTIALTLLIRFGLGATLREAAKNRAIPVTVYRKLARATGARRYYRMVIRIRRGIPRVRTIDAGRYL